jgi:transcriptional regulator with XRE-family HTH domain
VIFLDIRLKDIREARNMSQDDIAKQIGVSQQFISRVERGNKSISLDLAAEIADFLNVSLDEIAGRQNPEVNPNLEN